MTEKLTQIQYKEELLPAVYVRTDVICPGVTCEVYLDPTTGERDYGKVTVEPGYKTPKQRVLSGEETMVPHQPLILILKIRDSLMK
ncbi:MAG TPA: hypothetical protein PKJ26_03720 [Candidatus Woesebacteria bacterium]|nr:hypothetical protein [Candidatus Woesebacteria bacterium]HNS65578.1 hypothetical protein [Candidatus Woesebacteria bacterium]